MMNHPGAFIKAQHGHVAEYGSLILVDEVPGNLGIAGVDLGIGFFYLLFIFLNRDIFIGIDKSGLKKEIPQRIEIDIVADIRIFVFGLMKQGDELQMILNIHIQQGQAAFDPLLAAGGYHGFTKNYLGTALDFVAVSKTQFQLRQYHARQQRRIAFIFFYRKSRPGQIHNLKVDFRFGEWMLKYDVGRRR